MSKPMKLKLKDHKPILCIFRIADDELHTAIDTNIDVNDDTVVEFDESLFYYEYGSDFAVLMQGRNKTNPHKSSNWKDEWDG